jgi:hypothetical protein
MSEPVLKVRYYVDKAVIYGFPEDEAWQVFERVKEELRERDPDAKIVF